MNTFIRGIMWPAVALIAIGSTHLIAELARPQLQNVISPAVVMPIYLAAGAWAAFGTMRVGGGVGEGVVAAAVLGLLPVGLQLIGFGLIAGRVSETVLTSAVFGFVAILWGGFLGVGVRRSMFEPAGS